MPDSAQGVYTRPGSPIPVTGQNADAPQVNTPIDDMAAALNRRHFSDGRKPFTGDQDFNGYRATGGGDATDAQDFVTLGQVEALVASISGMFPGFMMVDTVTSTAAPAGWFFGNGQEVLRADAPALWARVAAGNNLAATQAAKTNGQYGPGNGSTTFTLPNVYGDDGYFIRPMASGRTIGSVQADELKAHPHTATFAGNPVPPHGHEVGANYVGSGNVSNGGYLLPSGTGATTTSNGGHTPSGTVTVAPAGGTETRPKNIAYPVLIKAA